MGYSVQKMTGAMNPRTVVFMMLIALIIINAQRTIVMKWGIHAVIHPKQKEHHVMITMHAH
jgi:hypothetical protein